MLRIGGRPTALARIASRTGKSEEEVYHLSLSKYAGALYGSQPERMYQDRVPWILPFKHYTADNYDIPFGRRYPYCPECSPEIRGEGRVWRIWRLAFVTACPLHRVPLVSYLEKGDLSEQKENLKGSLLLEVQETLLAAIQTGSVPSAFSGFASSGGTPPTSAHFFAGIGVIVSLLLSRSNGFHPRKYIQREASVTRVPNLSARRLIFANPEERRYLMKLLAWLLVGWPDRFYKMCLRCGVEKYTLASYRKGKREKTEWLLSHLPHRRERTDSLSEGEKTHLGTSPDRLQELDFSEIIQLGGDELKFQMGQVGITPGQIASAMPTDQQWEKVEGIFESRALGAGKWKGLIRRRTLFGLVLFSIRKGTPETGKLPPIIAKRIKQVRNKWTNDGRLEAAFTALGPRSLDPKGLIDWAAERKRLGRRRSGWKASDHYTRSRKGQAPDLPSGTHLLTRRRVFREGSKCARLRPAYYSLPGSSKNG